jgi:hypothetical protein
MWQRLLPSELIGNRETERYWISGITFKKYDANDLLPTARPHS